MNSTSLEPIAIIGIACEFAGDIHSPDDLWQALVESRDLVSDIPSDRTDLLSFCAHVLNQHGADFQEKLIHRGYFMSSSCFDTFEPSFFGLSDGEAATIDPGHRLLMLKTIHLLENAGYPIEKIRGTRTSVHIGQFSNDATLASSQLDIEYRTRYHAFTSLVYNASARLSYHFDLHGPNLTLDTACSSSLQAVQLAVQTLRLGEANMAICGGVNTVYTPEQLYNYSIAGPVSSDGRSCSFSTDAHGYAKGEGLGLVLLKRLSDAERDGDRIYCILHDVLSNHDGLEDKDAYVVPSPTGQQRLLADLYQRTDYDRRKVFYIEAHGTGTQVGDPIEANTLGRFFKRSPLDPPLLIGSIKSNIGHTEGVAGIAALIKVAMCMAHRAIPPNMHLSTLNPKIEKEKFNLHIVQNLASFPLPSNDNDSLVAIGINSFGIGGSNAHAIVEEYRPKKAIIENGHTNQNSLQQHFLFIFSAKSRESLHQMILLFNDWLQKLQNIDDDHSFLASLSRKLLLNRTTSHEHLAIFVCANSTELQKQINAFLSQNSSSGLLITKRILKIEFRLCFVFSGQGPQWWAMGRQLYESEPVFRKWIQKVDQEFTKVNADGWQLLDELIGKNEGNSRINDTNIAQPALFAVQVALTALLVSWNIYPNAIVSHSAGEQAAAFVSGRVSLSEAVRIVYHRSRLQHRNTRQGGRMLAVAMNEQEAHDLLLRDIEHLVTIASVNSPRSITLSGETANIEEIQQILSNLHPNVFKSQLRIENAFHSHQMDRFNIKEDMISSLNDIKGLPIQDKQRIFDAQCSQAHLYSSVFGRKIDDETPLDAHYWWSNVRQPVRFADAIQAIIQNEKIDVFLELSPHPVLATSIHESCQENTSSVQPLILPTLKRKEDEQKTLLMSVSQLIHSSDIWSHYLNSRSIQSTDDQEYSFDTFPLYPFNKTPCWYESKEATIKRLANRRSIHPLLGVRQWTRQTTPTWKSLINLKLSDFSYLKDHKIQDVVLFPAAGFIELALAACQQLLTTSTDNQRMSAIAFEKIQFIKSLPLIENNLVEIVTQVTMPMHEWSIYSRPWTTAGKDCMRTSGMSGKDFLNSFVDPETLNAYSLSEFTLHARGRIDVGPHLNAFATSALRLTTNTNDWRVFDPARTYSRLVSQGYQYGPRFQVVDSLNCTERKVIGQVHQNPEDQNDARYHLHPILFDGCFHTALSVFLNYETYVPVSIDKLIIYGSTFSVPQVTVFTEYHPTLHGIIQERSYTSTLSAFDSRHQFMDSNTKPIFILEKLKIQRFLSHWSPSGKTIFKIVNELADIHNTSLIEYIKKIEEEYCFVKKWSCKATKMYTNKDTSCLPRILLDNIQFIADNFKDNNENHHQLINSIEPFNVLAAHYALYALRDLATINSSEPLISEELKQCVTDSEYFLQLFYALLTLVRDQELVDEYGNIKLSITNHSIQLMRKQLITQYPLLKPLLTILHICGLQLGKILSGEKDVSDLFENKENESALEDMYSLLSSTKIHHTLEALAKYLQENNHHQRQLYIMIIGGGTCTVTLPILHKLVDLVNETDMHINLLYVDATLELLTEAKKLYQTALNDKKQNNQKLSISFEVFDIEDNTNETDIMEEKYHIAFAVNVLHTTSDTIYSLNSIRRLLQPGGLLLLIEPTVAHPYLDLIFGIFPFWWPNDTRDRAPLTRDQWQETVKSTDGFDPSLQITPINPYGDSLIILQKSTSPLVLNQLPERKDQTWLVIADQKYKLGHLLAPYLPNSNPTVLESTASYDEICLTIKNLLMEYNKLHIVFTWPLDAPDLSSDINEEAIFQWQVDHLCRTLLGILKTLQEHYHEKKPPSYIFILTQNAQFINDKTHFNPHVSSLIGLARSLAVEYAPHHIKLIDLHLCTTDFCQPSTIPSLAQYLIDSRFEHNLDEIVLHNNDNGMIEQLEWNYESIKQEHTEKASQSLETIIIPSKDSPTNPFRLQVASSRLLADLVWVKEPFIADTLLPDHIHVLVHCIGINFRDILKARGLYPHTRPYGQLEKDYSIHDRDDHPGIDFMGTVQRSSSNDFKVGDRVVGCTMRGAFHSHMVFNHYEAVRVSDNCSWSDAQLASLPTPFLTALYALKYRFHLRRNQTVLIHAATGATGQAFIQYCQSIGAKVIATAGSEQKRTFLREHYGIEHVFNSRDLSFVSQVLSVVPNGVDVVVNSLSGPLLQESIKLLASHGHFVELGKRDVFASSALSLFNLRADCSFHVVDLALLAVNQPKFSHELICDMMEHIHRGSFKPFEPIKIFEPSEVIEAFTQSGLGQSIGKSVIRIATSDKPLTLKENSIKSSTNTSQIQESMFPTIVSEKGTILISGGFGGLGLTMSRWMIEKHGIKRLALISRRTRLQLEQPESNPQFEEWLQLQTIATQSGTQIDIIQMDVTQYNDVYQTIERFNKTSYPIRGIIHSAVVSEDKLLANLDEQVLTRVMGPKILGAWNLHRASQDLGISLHFFIMFSSVRNHLLDPGSAGYNAGNEFLDALAFYRTRYLQQSALSISLPAISGAGMFHRQRHVLMDLYSNQGFETLPTLGTFELIERLFLKQNNCPSPIVFAVDWNTLNKNKDNLSTYQLARLVEQKIDMDSVSLEKRTANLESNLNVETIIEQTRETVMRLLGSLTIDRIDINRSLLSQGMDSLAAVSLYNWISDTWNTQIPLANILQGISIQSIGSQIHEKLINHSPSTSTTADNSLEKETNEPIADDSTPLASSKLTSSYRGIERLLDTRMGQAGRPTIFCICTEKRDFSSHEQLQQSTTGYNLYIVQAPTNLSTMGMSVQETIAQIRRLQPRGPYLLYAMDNEAKVIIEAILKELEKHNQVGVSRVISDDSLVQ